VALQVSHHWRIGITILMPLTAKIKPSFYVSGNTKVVHVDMKTSEHPQITLLAEDFETFVKELINETLGL